MRRGTSLSFRAKHSILRTAAVAAVCLVFSIGCSDVEHRNGDQRVTPYLTSDTRKPIPLSSSSAKEHRAVMLQHLETIQVIVNALVEDDYELAKGLTESHLGFFVHRQAIARQKPESFPPAYHDLALAHHEAAEALAHTIPTKDLKQIMPKFNNVLKACVACHLEYKVSAGS